MNTTSERRDLDLIKGVVAGLADGLLASFLMEQFQALWSGIAAQITNKARKASSGGKEPATVKAANAILLGTQGRPLSKANEPIAGEAVHYAVGAVSGGIYGRGTWFRGRPVAHCRRSNGAGVETVQTADGVSYLDACLRARVPPHLWVGDGAGAARGSPSTLGSGACVE